MYPHEVTSGMKAHDTPGSYGPAIRYGTLQEFEKHMTIEGRPEFQGSDDIEGREGRQLKTGCKMPSMIISKMRM